MNSNVRKKLEKINITGELKRNEPMWAHTTFKTGGPAEFFFIPRSTGDVQILLSFSREYDIPCFILGGGANILVADSGISGMVIDMKQLNSIELQGSICYAECGASISSASACAGKGEVSGLEFIYAMPGTVGGAIWMNARCYGSSLGDILFGVEYLDRNLEVKKLSREVILESFAYKKSFFQDHGGIILRGEFHLEPGNGKEIEQRMSRYKKDRELKGHFRYPSAGSVFKNNRALGRPTGAIIDSLGLRGRKIGGAQVAPFHGNIIINTGSATSREIKALIELCEHEVYRQYGTVLEREIQLVGLWQEGGLYEYVG